MQLLSHWAWMQHRQVLLLALLWGQALLPQPLLPQLPRLQSLQLVVLQPTAC